VIAPFAWAQSAGPVGVADQPAKSVHTTEESSELEEVVVSAVIGTYHEQVSSMASKIPMDVRDLASSLTIMNDTAIRDRNVVALTDVFAYVVGATQSQGNINGFSFRGFPNTGSYTQNIQFDGLMGATLKKAASTAANVDRLEFLKGPNSVLYGQMNPGGLLNIVTKSPEATPHYSVWAAIGAYAGEFSSGPSTTEDLSFDATGPVFGGDRLLYRIVVDAAKQPSSRPGSEDHSLSIYPSLTYKWSDTTFFTVKAEDSQDRRRMDDGLLPIFNSATTVTVPIGGVNTPTVAYGPTATWYTAPYDTVYNDRKDWTRDYGSALATFFHTEFDEWTLRFQSRSVWHEDEVQAFTLNDVYVPDSSYALPNSLIRRTYVHTKNGHRYNFADANLYRSFGPESFKNTILVGVGGGGEGFFNHRLSKGPDATVAQAITLFNPVLDQYGYPADGKRAANQVTYQTALGEYISDQIKIGDRFNISLGIRHDLQKTHGLDLIRPATTRFASQIDHLTRQAGVVWHVIPLISAYASYSQSLKPQTDVAYDQSGNSSFPPEGGEQYEGGLKFETADKNLNFSLAAYEINRTDVLVPTGQSFAVPTGTAIAGQPIFRLDGKQTSKGVEAELQWQPQPNWQIQAGYAHSKAIIAQSVTNPFTVGKDLENAPRNSGNFWTRYNVPRGVLSRLGFGLGVIYQDRSWAGDPTTEQYYLLPGWTRVDGSVYYKIGRNYNLALNIHNLLDRRFIAYAPPGTLTPAEERLLTLSLRASF
jgi:iron complex outermembrane receptor protein